jgi:hypothetical protein
MATYVVTDGSWKGRLVAILTGQDDQVVHRPATGEVCIWDFLGDEAIWSAPALLEVVG